MSLYSSSIEMHSTSEAFALHADSSRYNFKAQGFIGKATERAITTARALDTYDTELGFLGFHGG
ncbi:DNA replication licensing factor [Venturia inaequalis]|nr:DNA replication licensing factor [Venturia inaequalis]